jgi:hypothetical protein
MAAGTFGSYFALSRDIKHPSMKKKLLTASVAILIACSAIAQDCGNYYFLQNNKTIEMTVYNRKGDPDGRQIYTVSDVKNEGGSTTSSFQSEMFNKKGKSISKGTGKVQCQGGVMFVDMKVRLSEQQQEQFANADAKIDNMYIEYPPNMKAGDALKDANMTLDMDNKGMKQSLILNVINRKVEAKESVTTTAGTWECFKISSKNKITIKTMGIGVPVNFDVTEWYAPGFGIVKTESKYGTTAITSIK